MTSKFKSTFNVSDDRYNIYDKLLAQLFTKFIKHKYTLDNIIPIVDNTIFTNNYIRIILEQLNNETDNTVAVFEYDLYLYNLDTYNKR